MRVGVDIVWFCLFCGLECFIVESIRVLEILMDILEFEEFNFLVRDELVDLFID